MTDPLTRSLQELSGEIPKPRLNLSVAEKQSLVARIGPKTARSILQAKKDFPLQRIPFLFSALDTQDVVDLIYNDMMDVMSKALLKIKKKS